MKRFGVLGGPAPFGYRRSFRGIEINRAQAEAVRLAFAMRRDGAILQAIADELNRRDIPTSRGAEWRPASVYNSILGQERKYKGGPIKGMNGATWPVILGDFELPSDPDPEPVRYTRPKPAKKRYAGRKLKR